MVHREAFTRLCTATILDQKTGKALHTLAVTVSPPIPGKSGATTMKRSATAGRSDCHIEEVSA